MTTPALRALKQGAAGRRVTLLTSTAGAEVGRLVPEVDEVLIYDAPWMKAAAPHEPKVDLAVVEHLRASAFDAAAIFTVFSQNPLPAALLSYLAGIPLRLAHCRENPYQLLTDWVAETEPEREIRHEVRRQLDLVATIGCRVHDERLSLQLSREATGRAVRAARREGLDIGEPWVAIHPGASAPSRRYPAERFEGVARALLARGYQVAFTGSAEERELVESIRGASGSGACSLAGRLTLAETAALLSMAPLLIANNTAAVHLAAAVGTPVVDLYALTNPQHTPWGVPSRVLFHDVPCKHCYKSICPESHHNCLELVEPEEAVEAALELLEETSGQRRMDAYKSSEGAR